MLDKIYSRPDKATLKQLNASAFKKDDATIKEALVGAAAAPVVVLDTIETPTLKEIEGDSLRMLKINSAGMDCLFNPFYPEVVYTHGDYKRTSLYIDARTSGEIRGLVYGDRGEYTHALPLRLSLDDIAGAFKDNGNFNMNFSILDVDAVSQSKMCRSMIKKLTSLFDEGSGELKDSYAEYVDLLCTEIELGNHVWSETDLLDYGILIKEYSVAHVLLLYPLIKTIVGLGHMHINDYYPFVSARPGGKKRKVGKKKNNPVLDPNRTIVRMIQKKTAHERLDARSEKTGKQKAHSRRGCWVTLRADRYKNHPMYQVENGVYRRESWVNCEPFPIGNVIYTPVKH